MKKIIFVFLIALSSVSVFAQKSKLRKTFAPAKKTTTKKIPAPLAQTGEREKFDPAKNPNDDLQAAIVRATKEDKRIILDVGGEWCSWCIKMDNFIESHAELKKLRDENFVWVKINMSEENENKPFLAKYPEVEGYPHLFVLEKDGALLKSKDTSEIEEPNLPIIIPSDVKEKEKAIEAEREKRRARSYDLQKFADFLKEYSPAKTPALK